MTVNNTDAGQRIFPAYERHVLPNGMLCLLLPEHSLPLCVFRLVTRSGSAGDPPGKAGLARLTAELLHKGTRRRTTYQFSEAVEFCGGEVESVAEMDWSLAGGEFLSKDLRKGLSLFAEFVREPRFDDLDAERERDRLVAELSGRRDNPSYLAGLHYSRFLFGDHPYGTPVSGTARTLICITPEDVRVFYHTHYRPNNMILAIAGDFRAPQVLHMLETLFGDWPAGGLEPRPHRQASLVHGSRVLIVDKPDLTQTQVRFGNIGIARTSPDYYPVQAANNILGGGFTSRLVNQIRVNRGLSYHVRSRFRTMLEPGDYTVITSTKNESVREIIQVALEEVQKMRQEPVSAEELTGTQEYLTGLFPLGLEGIETLAKLMTDVEFYGLDPDFPNDYTNQIRKVTIPDIQRIAQTYFHHDDLAIVAVGRAQDIHDGLSVFGEVSVVPFETELAEAATGGSV